MPLGGTTAAINLLEEKRARGKRRGRDKKEEGREKDGVKVPETESFGTTLGGAKGALQPTLTHTYSSRRRPSVLFFKHVDSLTHQKESFFPSPKRRKERRRAAVAVVDRRPRRTRERASLSKTARSRGREEKDGSQTVDEEEEEHGTFVLHFTTG